MITLNTSAILIIFVLGGLGALCRALILWISKIINKDFPYGIIIVNAIASFITVYVGLSFDIHLAFYVISGFAVALGTLSSLCGAAISMIQNKKYWKFTWFLALNSILGIFTSVLAYNLTKLG